MYNTVLHYFDLFREVQPAFTMKAQKNVFIHESTLETSKIISISLLYYAFYIHINRPLESLYLLKEPHQNSLGSCKDLSIHMDRQREATLIYGEVLTI